MSNILNVTAIIAPRPPYGIGSILGLSVILLLGLSTVKADTLTEIVDFGANPGNLRMYTFIPDGLQDASPLVVALHGCNQRASDYDDEPGWVQLAQRWRFALVLPEQQRANNTFFCFNWFNGKHPFFDWFYYGSDWGSDIDRGRGEALSIKQMIDRITTDHRIDPERIFITGLSAGGAMTAVMLATYPTLFAGGAIIAGVPYKCALYSGEALSRCGLDLTRTGSVPIKDLSPAEWGERVRNASPHSGTWPTVSIWHGEADSTVTPAKPGKQNERFGQQIGKIKKGSHPIMALSGSSNAVLHYLAREGAVAKLTGLKELKMTGPARVFEDPETQGDR